MADHNKGGFISKAQKRLTRTKTKVLQNLGKAEKTADEKFDEHVHKLDRQQEVAHRFHKELRNYINCAKAMEMASKSFYAVMLETFETEWKGEATLRETLQALELMWSDYLQTLQESVQEPLTTYSNHFHPLKQRIAKRNRKLDYYDNARHNAEVQQNAKKKDEAKILKASEEREESRKIYDELNNELHHELPEFYNSRVNFYASTFKSFFNAENTFHGETGKLYDTAMNLSEELAEENKQYTYQPRPLSGVINNEDSVVNGHSSGDNDSTGSANNSSGKNEKASPRPDRPPSSPAAVINPLARVPENSSDHPKTNGDRLSNGLSSDTDSPPESPHINAESSHDVSGTTPVAPESPQSVVDQSIYETPKAAIKVVQTVTEAVIENSPKISDKMQIESDRPKVEPRKSKNVDVKMQIEGEKKKGPLYENSELNNTPPPERKPEVNIEDKKTESEEPVDDYEEPMVSVVTSAVNSAPGEEIKKEVVEAVKQTISEKPKNTPSTDPPSVPPELPKDPPPEDEEEVPPNVASKQTEEDESDHYYDRVPDQTDPNVNQDNDEDDSFYEIPSSSKIPDKLPDGCIFVVVATHLYKNEDEDELSFEAGELIYVVPYDDPDDQDDGWLMGIKKSDGRRGVFPENFTKRV